MLKTTSETASYNHQFTDLNQIKQKMQGATTKIAPLWPLERFTAVNPYLGMVHQTYQQTAAQLDKLGAIKSTLPAGFYIEKIKRGFLSAKVLEQAANHIDYPFAKLSLEELATKVEKLEAEDYVMPPATFADVASNSQTKDWSRFMVDRVANWASAFYDEGQAIWNHNSYTDSPFLHWKNEAAIDKTSSIMGLKGFCQYIKAMPEDETEAVQRALETLEITAAQANDYFHTLLLKCIGWGSHTARVDWERKQNGLEEKEQMSLLSILIVFEAAIFNTFHDEQLLKKWEAAKLQFENNGVYALSEKKAYKILLQEAFDLASQRNLINHINSHTEVVEKKHAKFQAMFCIDVRSEIYRRHLERTNDDIETLGYAGFFGFPIDYQEIGHEKTKPQAPVLLKPGITIKTEGNNSIDTQRIAYERRKNLQLSQLWKSFKSSAVSCFSFVSPLGLAVLPKLIGDSFGLSRPFQSAKDAGLSKKNQQHLHLALDASTDGDESYGMSLETQIAVSFGALKTMSLTNNFAELVAFIGHGGNMTNNPHATAYDCGACGGHTGEANAKVAAQVLNKTAVRQGLAEKGIKIPESTLFVAGLHDTTTDHVEIFMETVNAKQQQNLLEFKVNLKEAARHCRKERFTRFEQVGYADIDKAVRSRSNDWSQLRPEWGLAGCHAFIIAPRPLTKHIDLSGKTFLHSYEPSLDADFSTLESIMTAPMVVTSWINLQYFASTVDNRHFGSGNKTLHNITSALGVIEGFGGDLRVGLPEQAVHDGTNFQHEPVRLSVIVNAPTDAIKNIIEKHEHIKNLVQNEWIYLMHMNDVGQVTHKCANDLSWKVV